MQWFGTKIPFGRFLGQVDQDDPTNLPVGLSAICRNTDFTRDSGGVTCANTRAGNNLAIQLVGTNKLPAKDPATGGIFFQYEPELSTDATLFPPAGYFQMPIFFEKGGCLQREFPVGTGRCVQLPASDLVTPPAGAHMLGASAGNKVFAAFSDLTKPLSRGMVIDPKAILANGANAVTPLGLRPFGWLWQPNTDVALGEVCCPPTPATGNGHTYQCTQAGRTGAAAPVFTTGEGDVIPDGTAKWTEKTMVLANRLPAPPAPTIARAPGTGAFAAGLDVYIRTAYVNPQGDSLVSEPSILAGTNLNDAVNVTIPALAALPGWMQTLDLAQYRPSGMLVFVAVVAHGAAAPAVSTYKQWASVASLGTVVVVTTSAAGAAPPTSCTARVVPGQLPTPVTEPIIQRNGGAGAFAAGRDVYVRTTYLNTVGETKPGPANSIVNTVANDAVQVTTDQPLAADGTALYTITLIGVYEADVPTGQPAPSADQFSLVGKYAPGTTLNITTTAAGVNPPTSNSSGPAGNIQADTSAGGPNATQGYRYAVIVFVNSNGTFSGFTVAAAVAYDVDEDGWELGAFNILTGPDNVVARCVCFTSADSSQSGPYDWIGLLNLIDTSTNIVYPDYTPSDSVDQVATVLFDNVTTQAVFNFTDSFLQSSNNVDDRTAVLAPFQPARIDYLKTIDALAYSGVLGYSGGGLISITSDYESVRADTGTIPFPADGQRCFGFTDAYKSVIFGLREEGGYAIQPDSGDPSGWRVVQRWDQVGPCGFRAWAAIGKFIIFVHRSGVYRYDQSDPDLMSKEIPRSWSRINWQAAEGIAVTIDEDTHTVRIQVPVDGSTVNNCEFCLSYLEGWLNPIHYSTFAGKEISMEAARRWSFNDVCATMAVRMNRTLPGVPPQVLGANWETAPDSSYYVSQLLYLGSGFDGAIQARTPGVYSDNGVGIDWVWESVCAGMMQAVAKPEGINLNLLGDGTLTAYFVAARDMIEGPGGQAANVLLLGPVGGVAIDPNQKRGITLKCEPNVNEFWRVHLDNGKVPGAWFSLKTMMVYLIPFTVGRDFGDK